MNWLLEHQKIIKTKGIKSADPQLSVHDRQMKAPGHDQSKYASDSGVLIAGAGALGSPIAKWLVRMGVKALAVVDPDYVEVTNLHRQGEFLEADIGERKSWALIGNLENQCTSPCTLVGIHGCLEDLVAVGFGLSNYKVLVICGDNGELRIAGAKLGLQLSIPCIFTAIDTRAEYGYVAIQRSKLDAACFGCFFPEVNQEPAPCAAAATPDVAQVICGLAVRAVNSALEMPISLNWNYREIHLNGHSPDLCEVVPKRSSCCLCRVI